MLNHPCLLKNAVYKKIFIKIFINIFINKIEIKRITNDNIII